MTYDILNPHGHRVGQVDLDDFDGCLLPSFALVPSGLLNKGDVECPAASPRPARQIEEDNL